ncbi:hypothetical protein PY365_10860 [Roseiarcaceae bacterium H3SJ34-1]|uniref:hypothetical protein n=1 Tax=Terripilifer ovatus TaxID=3032367 RepID=UPI003AB98D22|nr:hypothetical protein [Roseiarcaceae bacterium H3SJ34-1]
MSDIPISLMILMVVTAAVLVRGFFLQEAGYLKYPFLAAAVVAGWFIPQAIGLAKDVRLPEGAYDLTMIYAAMSLIAAVVGDRWKSRVPVANTWVYNETRLAIGAMVLSAIGAVAFALILRGGAETSTEGTGTGIVTIYFFLYALQYMGLALALLLLLQKFSWFTFGIVAFDYSSVSGFVLFGGRRGAALDVAFITICAFWFTRRILLPRLLMIAGMIFGALMVNVAGEYRQLIATINKNSSEPRLPTFQEFMEIPFLDHFHDTTTKGSFEVKNAIYYIASAFQNGTYDYGAHYWNFFVFRYIPAQFLGADFKQSLMFELPNDPSRIYDYTRHVGTTYTGFADTFSGFSFLGIFVFTLIAAIMTKWWAAALAGDFKSRLVYCATVATAMESITHSTEWFFIFLPQVFIFTFPILYWARERRAEGYSTPQMAGTSARWQVRQSSRTPRTVGN